MATNVKFKRSAVQGKVPTTADLDLGQLALNTYDGVLYLKKSVNSVESVIGLSNDYNNLVNTPTNLTDFTNDLTELVNGSYTLSVNADGSISLPAFDLPSTIGTAGQILKVSSSGTLLEWSDQLPPGSLSASEIDSYDNITNQVDGVTTFRFDSSTLSLTDLGNGEVKISATASGGGVNQSIEYFTGDGATVNFDLADTVTDPDYAVVSLNGVELRYGVDYTFISSGTVLRFEEQDGTENPPADESTISIRTFVAGGSVVGVIDDLTDVDTTTIAPTVGQALVWDGTNWIPGDAGTGAGSPVVSNFTGDGTTTTFDIGHLIANEASLLVFVNSVYQDTDVYSISGTEVSFTEAPYEDDRINIILLTTTIASGSNGSIDDLTDVDTSGTFDIGQTLVWDGTNWVPGDAIPAGLTTSEQLDYRTRIGAASVEDAIMLSIVMA